MGIVISFPANQRTIPSESRAAPSEPGTVVILPVIRVDRLPDEPSGGMETGARATGRKRRRRASRS